ncbi:MAG: CBS domain containing membrane protein [uncultured archaeon A07HB70]|nr:MAG: CBS domain containing membrane protein [uncultured archaeon A07HB70]
MARDRDQRPPSRIRSRAAAAVRRLRRIERREATEARSWLENTDNLLHLTVVVAVPGLVGAVTYLSATVAVVSFLLFPPLAAGAYTLFADPEGQYADPRRFVGGLTAGAACGVGAVELSGTGATPGADPLAAGLAVFLTALVTWAVDVELPTAFSTALLVLATGVTRLVFFAGMVGSALLVAGVFVAWRRLFYERRARYLYEAVRGDDHVLVPYTREAGWPVVALGAGLAAAHDAGKVVLLGVVDEADAGSRATAVDGRGERSAPPRDASETEVDPATVGGDSGDHADADPGLAAADRLESVAARVRERFDVPCEVVVAAGDVSAAIRRTAADTNCDLVAVGLDAPHARSVLAGEHDAVALRSQTDASAWHRVLVMVARPGDSAHAMIDFAERLADEGHVSVCTCIDDEAERRRAEARLANLAETAGESVETRVARASVGSFVERNAAVYDLVLVGASGDRSRASRLVVPPTFERLGDTDGGDAGVDLDIDVDVGVVSRR